ncbi:MAG TPA: histidine kinase dimerization/phospho-acceptor domain-containing protein, partial [Chthoniobacterales bacterium]|nr:histidine kinase dimerization/phospho-acceptor domain-containing protein [Chthoniobacterales bacterium]
MKAFLSALAQLRHVSSPDRLDAVLQQNSPAILVLDLRAKEARDLLEQIQAALPEILVIALGTLRSEPLREVENSGVYAAEDLQIDRRRLQGLVTRGFDHLRVLQENRDLREHAITPYAQPEPARRSELSLERREPAMPLLRFPRVFRRFDNVEALLANLVESVADATSIARVGIFSKIRQSDRYRLRAGVRCLPETYEIEYGERDALVRWFELHAHLISRANLPHVDPAQRAIMRRALDMFAAEVIVPLHAGGRIIGWIFFGHRVTGERFDSSDLEGLMALAEHVATVLENALLNEEVTVQKTLAETLLKSIPPGIVATDEEANIRWFNPTAEQILGVDAGDALNQPVEAVGGKLAAFLRETLETPETLPARQWIDPNTRRSLSVETRRLVDQKTALGAVAVVHDLTAEDNLRQKQDLVDRAAFWTDLAASMSHEIRNPLVAIKTFAQLLPERFEDPDFRKDFNEIVVQEIDRLDKIITQINNFAHPSELVMKPVDVRSSVKKAIELAKTRVTKNGVAIDTTLPNDLPRVLGDENALAEA